VLVTAVVLLLIFNPFDGKDEKEGAAVNQPTSSTTTTSSTAATATAGECPKITAWQAEYWDNEELRGDPVLCRNEFRINHEWGEDSPVSDVPKDHFSARFTRTIHFPAGRYEFYLNSDDSVRLWVDEILVIDRREQSPIPESLTDVNLSEGDHKLRVEYKEIGENAFITLSWTAVPDCAPGVIYCEDFENGRADDRNLEPGWEVVESSDNHHLQGSENSYAFLQHTGWADYRLRFRFKLDQGRLQLYFRYLPEEMQWYIVGNTETGIFYLVRIDGEETVNLANSQSVFIGHVWHDAEIIGEGRKIQVYMDGTLLLEYEDEYPVLQGTIVFEPLADSQVQIDDIEIWPVYVEFSEPMIDDYRLDLCVTPGVECGEPAATAWCQQQGFFEATDFEEDLNIGARGLEAITIGSSQIVNVDAFKSITCR
jgi:hypothetical protein